MKKTRHILTFILFVAVQFPVYAQPRGQISGRVTSEEDGIIGFASVYLKDTPYGSSTDGEGVYRLGVPAGEYTLVVSAMGYTTVELPVTVAAGGEGSPGRNRNHGRGTGGAGRGFGIRGRPCAGIGL